MAAKEFRINNLARRERCMPPREHPLSLSLPSIHGVRNSFELVQRKDIIKDGIERNLFAQQVSTQLLLLLLLRLTAFDIFLRPRDQGKVLPRLVTI